jgi:hypothetical protein
MPDRDPPERDRGDARPSAEGERASFLDEPEPDWVERLTENRKQQVKRWERVFGTERTVPPRDEDARRPRRRLRRTDEAVAKETPAFYDQDEEEP